MKGIYKIKNIVTGEYYIGSSKTLNIRLLSHKSYLRRDAHPNYKLQESYNKFGEDSFVFYVVKESSVDATASELVQLEQWFIDNSDKTKLFNKSYNANGGRGLLLGDCYVLDLNGNVIKEFTSFSECFRWLQIPNSMDTINTSLIYKNKYRIVTKDFLNENIGTITNWSKGDYKINYKSCKVYCDFNYEVLEFDNFKCASNFLGISQSGIIQILKGKKKINPFNIRVIK